MTNVTVPFNKPFITGSELSCIAEAIRTGNLGGDGVFTEKCASFLESRLGIHKVLMTSSCAAALEIAVMLCGLRPGDEVILPSYTFVSTANAIVRMGARPVFVDIRPDTLNLDERLVEEAVTGLTRAIVAVHYGGVACEMDRLREIAAASFELLYGLACLALAVLLWRYAARLPETYLRPAPREGRWLS
jgi:dTDP-4-amino-4,6-dideoxygalactose transaminase